MLIVADFCENWSSFHSFTGTWFSGTSWIDVVNLSGITKTSKEEVRSGRKGRIGDSVQKAFWALIYIAREHCV